jgi:acyl-CoA reductase-like NAD-dependent aldehyde dehydrogenase
MSTVIDDPRAEQRQLGIARPLIDGAWLEQTSLGEVDHTDPATGRVNGTIAMCGPEEVEAAVAAAKRAYPAWRALSADKRRRILQRIEELVEADLPELGRRATAELGHPLSTSTSLSYMCAAWFGYYAGWSDKIEGATIPLTPAFNAGFDYTLAEPYGVVGIILTWNGPMVSVGMKVAPALAAGNCVVLKTPDLAPYTVARFAELALEAGVPPGVLHVLPGGAEAGEALVRHPDVGKITFTGGIATAKKILDAARRTVKPVVLELGGKSANLVFPDADLDAAAALSVHSCFTMAGQGCVLATRMLVHRSVYDEVVTATEKAISGLRLGDPFASDTTLGPVVNEAAYARVLAAMRRAQTDTAARLISGGHAAPPDKLAPDIAGGYYLEPTLLADVDPYSPIAQEEVFGPVLTVTSFDTEEQAVDIANSTPYGLGAFVQTRDIARVHRIAPLLQAGTISVNGASGLPPGAPFGGYNQSGYGREGGREGLFEFLRTKNVFIRI